MATITHHCDDCGHEITGDCCPDHPEAEILSVGPYTPAATENHGTLYDYASNDEIHPATAEERERSLAAAELDGGVGAFEIDGVTYYVGD